jgi:hypothetical protein
MQVNKAHTMNYKEAQQSAKEALRAFTVRRDNGTANLGIRRYKQSHPHLRGKLIRAEKVKRCGS